MFLWELGTRLKFGQADNWYMHKLEYLLENEIHKIIWDIEIQIDHRIPIRRPDLIMIEKRKELVI